MTIEIVNACRGYFQTLYELNRKLITLCGVDVIDNSGQYESLASEIILDIPRLVPYAFEPAQKAYTLKNGDGAPGVYK